MSVLRCVLVLSSLATWSLATRAVADEPPPAHANCPGDCNRDGAVGINELIAGVNLALDAPDAPVCDGLDIDGSAAIGVNELIAAVNNALAGCPRPVAGVEAIAGATLGVARGLSGISSVLLATVSAINAGNESGRRAALADDPIGGVAAACPLGGTNDRSCDDLGSFMIRETFSWDTCGYSRPAGSLELGGMIALTALGSCPGLFLPTNVGVDMDFTTALIDTASGARRAYRLQATGTLNSVTFGDRPCPIKGGEATITGTVTSQLNGTTVNVLELHGTTLNLTFSDFSGNCEPATSTMRVDGMAGINDEADPPFALDVQFAALTLVQHQTDELEGATDISGGLQSSCFGGSITMQTTEPLGAAVAQACPSGGVLSVTEGSGRAEIRYGADGTVDIDNGADSTIDEHFESCLAEPLRVCAE